MAENSLGLNGWGGGGVSASKKKFQKRVLKKLSAAILLEQKERQNLECGDLELQPLVNS